MSPGRFIIERIRGAPGRPLHRSDVLPQMLLQSAAGGLVEGNRTDAGAVQLVKMRLHRIAIPQMQQSLVGCVIDIKPQLELIDPVQPSRLHSAGPDPVAIHEGSIVAVVHAPMAGVLGKPDGPLIGPGHECPPGKGLPGPCLVLLHPAEVLRILYI